MTRRWMVLWVLALAAAVTTTDLFDAQTGERVGTIREGAGSTVDVFRPDGSRAGWGRQNPDGSTELFDTKGNRIGTVTRDGAIRKERKRDDPQR